MNQTALNPAHREGDLVRIIAQLESLAHDSEAQQQLIGCEITLGEAHKGWRNQDGRSEEPYYSTDMMVGEWPPFMVYVGDSEIELVDPNRKTGKITQR